MSPTLSELGYTSEKYRVGAPPLQSLPLYTTELESATSQRQAFAHILPQIEQILEHSRAKEELETGSVTILIEADWNTQASKQWPLAINEIRNMLLALKEIFSACKVEMISWQAWTELKFQGVEEADPSLPAAWPDLLLVIDQMRTALRAKEMLEACKADMISWRTEAAPGRIRIDVVQENERSLRQTKHGSTSGPKSTPSSANTRPLRPIGPQSTSCEWEWDPGRRRTPYPSSSPSAYIDESLTQS